MLKFQVPIPATNMDIWNTKILVYTEENFDFNTRCIYKCWLFNVVFISFQYQIITCSDKPLRCLVE